MLYATGPWTWHGEPVLDKKGWRPLLYTYDF